MIVNVLANSFSTGTLGTVESKFVLDLLAYLSFKRLWNNTLMDNLLFDRNTLYRGLRKCDSPFIPYPPDKMERNKGWRTILY
jgi:hypothetical protein